MCIFVSGDTMRFICSTLLTFLVVKEGWCRSTSRMVPTLMSPEDAELDSADTPQPDKLPEAPRGPKGLIRGHSPWYLAGLAGPWALTGSRRFAPRAEPTAAQVPQPQMPGGGEMPGGFQQMPQMPPQMSDMSQMPPMPQPPSFGRQRRSPNVIRQIREMNRRRERET